jgi:hypothetical protein
MGIKTKTSYQPKWKHGETKTIRVPKALEKDILRIAQALDNDYVKADEILELFLNSSLDTRQAG